MNDRGIDYRAQSCTCVTQFICTWLVYMDVISFIEKNKQPRQTYLQHNLNGPLMPFPIRCSTLVCPPRSALIYSPTSHQPTYANRKTELRQNVLKGLYVSVFILQTDGMKPYRAPELFPSDSY